MGTLVVYTALGSRAVQIAHAQDLPPSGQSSAAPHELQSPPVRRFDIPAGPLASVLGGFQAGAGLRIELAQPELAAIASPGVTGWYTDEQALTRILADTGLTFRFSSARTVLITIRSVSTRVSVTESGPQLTPSLPKYQQTLKETPQSISVISQPVMRAQASTTLRDVLRNVAGISLAAGEGGAQGDNLTIRGFAARNDLFMDGMRDFGSYYRDPFNTEEVAVLQGPSSVTFGRGSTGGVVNQETKTPGLTQFVSADLDFGTDRTRRFALDVDRPVPSLGSGAAVRLNLMGDMGRVAGRDVAESRRFGIAPSLSLGLGTPTRWTFSYFHQTGDDQPDYGLPWLFNGPAPVNRTNYYGFRDGNYLRTYDDIGTVRVEHDVNSHVTIRNQARYANYVRDVLITEPQIAAPTLSTPLADLWVNRKQIGVNSTETFADDQLDMISHFRTGAVKHSLVAGIEVGRETSAPVRPTYTNVPGTSLLDPNPGDTFGGTAAITSRVRTRAWTQSAYALETLTLGRKWHLTGGIRWDRFATDYHQAVAPAAAFQRVDEMPSWRSALVYQPVSAGSVYAAAGNSFNPSAESLSLSAGTANLPPEENHDYEAGTKWDLFHGALSLRGALFRTEKENAREADPTNSLLYVLAGTQRVDGEEVDVTGRITGRWEILSGYAHLDSRVVNSRFYPGAVGYSLANVPRNTFNVWSSHHLPLHWTIGAGANYVSSRSASSTIPLDPATRAVKQVPGYWLFNAMASHPLNDHIDLQLNLYNAANRYYYDELHPAHIVPGAGRSALAGLRFRF
jgi:catecholate siderophore receptor